MRTTKLVSAKRGFIAAASVVALIGFATSASASDLIVDGGFETPAPASDTPAASPGQGYQLVSAGSSFGTSNAWTVAYQPGATGFTGDNVALGPTVEYASPNIFYNAQSGEQSLDLSGGNDNGHPLGVIQTVSTVAGTTYTLSFYLASWVDQPDAMVGVYVDGLSVGVFTNDSNTGGRGSLSPDPTYPDFLDGNLWDAYTYQFTATGASTSIGFYNNSASGVTEVGLDDVSLTAPVSGVPEPATWALLL
ncbi:MAG: hypothetical protein ACREEB_00175, partial [Caulobacteraceae bacterium]